MEQESKALKKSSVLYIGCEIVFSSDYQLVTCLCGTILLFLWIFVGLR